MKSTDEQIADLIAFFANMPFNATLQLKVDYVRETEASVNFNMNKSLIGNVAQGILHGGVISSVLDVIGGLLVCSTILRKHPDETAENNIKRLINVGTVNLHINFLRPGHGSHFTAKAQLEKWGNTTAFTRMELRNDAGKLIASALGTYHIG